MQESPDGTPANRAWTAYTAFYLEAAPANEGAALWGLEGTWIDFITNFTHFGAPGASMIGNGRRDTWLIRNRLETTSETNRAAQICADKSLNGFNDWFLPSSGELNQLFENRIAAGMPSDDFFWSSSQSSSTQAWLQDFVFGTRADMTKNNPHAPVLVRAIRAF